VKYFDKPKISPAAATPANSCHYCRHVRYEHDAKREQRPADAIMLADEFAQSLLGDSAHARRHLLHQSEHKSDDEQQP
jgi:hypothetical protein